MRLTNEARFDILCLKNGCTHDGDIAYRSSYGDNAAAKDIRGHTLELVDCICSDVASSMRSSCGDFRNEHGI